MYQKRTGGHGVPYFIWDQRAFLTMHADKLNLKIIESNFDQIWLIKVPKNPHLTLDPYPIPPAFWAPFQ